MGTAFGIFAGTTNLAAIRLNLMSTRTFFKYLQFIFPGLDKQLYIDFTTLSVYWGGAIPIAD